MTFSTFLFYIMLAFFLYHVINLVRSTLTKYAAELRTALHELQKTKAALSDTTRALRLRTEDLQSERARAEALQADAARASAAADAAAAAADALRERLAKADARLASLQDAAEQSVMRWELAARFGAPEETRMEALNLLRRPPDRPGAVRARGRRVAATTAATTAATAAAGAAAGAAGASGGGGAAATVRSEPSEAFLLAAQPDLSISDSEDDSLGDDDPFGAQQYGGGVGGGMGMGMGRRPARPAINPHMGVVSIPPRRHRANASTASGRSSSASPPPPRFGQGHHFHSGHGGGAGGKGSVPAEFVGFDRGADADSEAVEGATGPVAQERPAVAEAPVSQLRRRRRWEGQREQTGSSSGSGRSSSSSLSSLSASAMVPPPHARLPLAGGREGVTARQPIARRGSGMDLPTVVELAPNRWPRSRSATQGLRNVDSGDDLG